MNEYIKEIEEIKVTFTHELEDVNDLDMLDDLRIKYLSKKGIFSNYQKLMKEVSDKKAFGQILNDLKSHFTSGIETKKLYFEELELEKKLVEHKIDISMPSRKINVGTQSILLQTSREAERIFMDMGFEIAQGYEVESDFYNFEALNLAANHPARDMQDTFYINPQLLLRTHTSNSQARTLSSNDDKSFKIITPGKVYRRDDDDATHSHQFMQMEGLVVVNKNEGLYASLKELKTVLTIFSQKFFNRDDISIRMRPSYFPFTEPSVEVDISCTNCSGNGCNICKGSGWIEILGAGVVHKNVLSHGGYDPEIYSGYAFGMGIERIAILKYNIEDIRIFYQNDYRFLKQF